MSQERLDDLVATLASTRPVLDDVARARVAAAVLQATRKPEAAPRPSNRRRWAIVAAVAVAVVTVAVSLRGTRGDRAAAIAPAPGAAELPEGIVVAATRGDTVRGQVDGAALTLYGPGRATRHGRRVVVDADALVVDRPGGDGQVELEIRTATIRMKYAAFSVSDVNVFQVTVLRGELLLSCAGSTADQRVMAGGSATCGAARTAADRPEPDAPPSPHPPGDDAPSPASAPPAIFTSVPRMTQHRPIERAPSQELPVTTVRDPGAQPLATINHGPSRSSPASTDAPSPVPPATTPEPAPPATTPEPAPPAVAPELTSPTLAPAPPADLASRYAAAERLMATDVAAARTALRALVTDAPTAPEAAPALLDLARLATATGDDVAAQTALDQLAAHPGAASLAMSATYLRCVLERTDPGRRTCLAGFRAAFPDSPRDADVLARLAIATARAGDCRAALPLLAEHEQRYPNGPGAGDVRAWRARCQSAPAR